MPWSVGDKLGHYEIICLLGKGGLGGVYRARDTKLKRDGRSREGRTKQNQPEGI
jgi:hypothetical protein